MEEIINDYEYFILLEDIKNRNYSYDNVIDLWNAIDNESPTYGEYSDYDIAIAIVFLINKLENSIPKSKIKEKIKEIKYFKNLNASCWDNDTNYDYINKVLKELLESEEK